MNKVWEKISSSHSKVIYDGVLYEKEVITSKITENNKLFSKHISQKDAVAVLLDKSAVSLFIILALVKRNICFIPIDSELPRAKILLTIQKLGVSWVLIDEVFLPKVDFKIIESIPFLGNNFLLNIKSLKTVNIPENTALILNTSGSTGIPKSIPISYGSLNYFAEWSSRVFLNQNSCVLNITKWHFDLSLFDLFASFYANATLVIPKFKSLLINKEIPEYISKNHINTIYTTPSIFRNILDGKKSIENLKTVLLAGEPLYKKDMYMAGVKLPNTNLYNLYGPTETNVCLYSKVDGKRINNNRVAIGSKENLNLNGVLIDEYNKVTEIIGELCIRNESTLKNYLNANTPFILRNKQKYYKTGDVVEIIGEAVYFCGRKDRQIKINGNRVELEEIENIILSNDAITEVCVVFNEKWQKPLVAFIQIKKEIDYYTFKKYCSKFLAGFAIPKKMIILEQLPKTTTGKINLKELLNFEF